MRTLKLSRSYKNCSLVSGFDVYFAGTYCLLFLLDLNMILLDRFKLSENFKIKA